MAKKGYNSKYERQKMARNYAKWVKKIKCSIFSVEVIEFIKLLYCIRIRMRGDIYGKIWPGPKGNLDGSDHILHNPIPNNDILSSHSCNITLRTRSIF